MDAGKVAGLLVLLGVVGVLAAIVGSGLEAGPVKFAAIPGPRQKLLAAVSVAVIVGGVVWWVVQQPRPAGRPKASAVAVAPGTLRIVLVPSSGNLRVGDTLSVSSNVMDADGGLGTDPGVLPWRDDVGSRLVRSDTTKCLATFTEPSVSVAGIHRISARAEGLAGASGTGARSVEVTVQRGFRS